MKQVSCANCGKALSVPERIGDALAVCNSACYHYYIDKVSSELYEVDFCAKNGWVCLSEKESVKTK